MTSPGIIGRVISVQSTNLRIALEVGASGFTKAGPNGLQNVGVVNSYVTIPTGAHRIVAIVTGVSISQEAEYSSRHEYFSQDDLSMHTLEASVVGRFEGSTFKSGLTGYPPLHAPVIAAAPNEVKSIFIPNNATSLRLGTSAVDAEQEVFLDANRLLGHHCAVVGSTGSGKSCTVTAILDGLLDHSIPNGHIVIFDVNGEYAKSFSAGTERGQKTRTIVLGPNLGSKEGFFLPNWFMNNEEHLSLFRASEGVQAPILQRSIADARAASDSADTDVYNLQAVQSTIVVIEQMLQDSKNSEAPVAKQLNSLNTLTQKQAITSASRCTDQWNTMFGHVRNTQNQLNLNPSANWQVLSATQKEILIRFLGEIRQLISEAFGVLGMGSSKASPNFDAPIYYSLQQLCDYFLPSRIKMEQAHDNKIAGYIATLQMRLSRLLADGRYDFMNRVENHHDPLGSYLRLLMGEDPTKNINESDWPAAHTYRSQASSHKKGPSITIFDLSIVASDVLENVTALLGRLLFDFSVRSQPRAAYPTLLVLEEAHRFVPSRQDNDGHGTKSTVVFERIAKEGRKFGLSLLLASQRPSELSETVVAQCGTVVAHRLTHEADQNLLRHATALSSRALIDQLPSLAQQHALVTGVSTGAPVAVRIRDVQNPPQSKDPDFLDSWSNPEGRKGLPDHIDRIVEGWIGKAD